MDGRELEQIANTLKRAGAAPTETPKAMRALGARALAPPEIVSHRPDRARRTGGVRGAAVIARSVERIMRNDPGTRLGDTEALHQMRVGTRRLRSDLRTFASLVDRDWASICAGELKRLGEVLGEVRDLDVLEQRLGDSATGLQPALSELFAELEQRNDRARARLLEVLREPAYVELLDRLVEAAARPAADAGRLAAVRRGAAAAGLEADQEAARRRQASSKTTARSSDFHRVRILAKRARYASEAVAPALGNGERQQALRFAERAADVQDTLGELQDSRVAQQLIADFVTSKSKDGPTCFAAGRLDERQQQRAQRTFKRFPKRWRRLRRAAWPEG